MPLQFFVITRMLVSNEKYILKSAIGSFLLSEFMIWMLSIRKKSHTCEEDGAHIRFSFWHLLMNFEKPKKSEFWKNEKNLPEISSFYKCVPRTTIIWGAVPEIWSETYFYHFGPFFAPPPSPKNHDQMMYAYQARKFGRNNRFITASFPLLIKDGNINLFPQIHL